MGDATIQSTLTLHPDATDRTAGTFALTIVPPIDEAGACPRPRAVAFVLDRSGSMDGWKIVAARRAMARMIDTLNDADRFCLLAFDSVMESPPGLSGGLAQANDRNRFRAVEYLSGLGARGGTEMADPLAHAVDVLAEVSHEERDRVLVLVTDGQVGNEDQILATLGQQAYLAFAFSLWESTRPSMTRSCGGWPIEAAACASWWNRKRGSTKSCNRCIAGSVRRF